MSSQKALQLPKKQAPFLLSTREIPTPSPDEIIVQVKAVALNPIDWIIQAYGLFFKDEDYPAVLGYDISGVVESVGIDVKEKFSVGDRVVTFSTVPPSVKNSNDYGGFQQYARAFADLATKIPDSTSFSEAATIPVCLGTAALGLFSDHGAGLNPTFDKTVKHHGQAAVVVGGASSVGQYAIQLLKLAGFSTIITYASQHNEEHLISLGATHNIDRKSITVQDLPSKVKNITKGSSPVKVVLDAISHPDTQESSYAILAESETGGTLALTGNVADTIKNVISESKKIKVHRIFAFFTIEQNREFGRRLVGSLAKLLEDGAVVPNKLEELPNGLAGIPEGLERLKNGKVSCLKLVALPQETK
ncbi:GroES-like protein [Marasmius fiardii PR-910]|nr:GroES-like protein [Marasmius fiardii PR-910]